MGRYLMTHSLLASWLYTMKENPYEDMTTERDPMSEFMQTLRRDPTPTTEAMQNGIKFEDIYGFGEVVAGLVCLFIAFALLHILRDIVAVLFLLSLEVFEAALQLLQLVDDTLQILAADLVHG